MATCMYETWPPDTRAGRVRRRQPLPVKAGRLRVAAPAQALPYSHWKRLRAQSFDIEMISEIFQTPPTLRNCH
ncbi:MAG: hypothetical protein K0S21_463 [Rhizobiaceae bacterium]|jgi:hypothetical protein|nr:hypothetical protein [Rhizobiaceae bacterium]